MRLPRLIALSLLAGCCLLSNARGQDLIQESIPRRWLAEFLPEKLPELKYPAYFNDLDKAKLQAFTGRYKTALITLQKVHKGDAGEIALTKATALAATGRREQALKVLSDPAIAKRASVQVKRANILAELGRLDEALSILKGVVQQNPDSVAGHFYQGQICEKTGDLATARQAYEWIYKTYYEQWQGQGARDFEDAEQVTLMGRAFDRYAALTGAYANNASLPNTILKVFVQAYDLIDRDYWPAHVAAAEYFLSHSDPRQAMEELKQAAARNPNDVHIHELLCHMALDTFNFDAADDAIAAIRKVDATSVVADMLECRALLHQRRPQDAEAPIQRVLAQQPGNIEAMGLLASAYALQLEEGKVQDLLKKIERIDPNNASAYLDLAEQLSAMRQYPRAEKMYQVAIDRAPWWTAPRNGLGLLLTQSGDETKARVVLDAAYALDPFNFRTTNYLILLEKLEKMARKESPHFVIFYDQRQDPIIADYFSEYMENVYKSVCTEYRHEPAVKTYIEVFPTHEEFSVRTTGSPWIGTVGASTGRVIALVSPRSGGATLGTYNWSQVLRHEYTHTVTLSATENRIAHWMTEGLAVSEEHSPVRFEWVPMLYNAVQKKQLFSMDQLTWAFVRPRRPQDRQLAYAQSFWICQYIQEKWGRQTILKMMADFKAGRTEGQVLQDCLKLSPQAFSTEFFAWAGKQVAGWGYDEKTSKQYDELVKKAETLVQAGQYADAVKAWEEIVKLRPMDELPHQRLAGLYLSKEVHNPQKAIEHLVRLEKVSLKDNRFAKRIARVYVDDLNEPRKAEKYALDAVYTDPYDPDAHELLAGVYEKDGNAAGAAREKDVLARLKQWTEEQKKGQ